MSVKVHEPVCLDSAQDLYFWFDHFLGDQLKDEWNTSIAGAGTIVVVDAQTGGIIRFTTGATSGNECIINWANIRSLLVSKKVTMELRVKLSSVALETAYFSLWSVWNDMISFWYNTATSANWMLRTRAGGANTQVDSGIAVDTDYHIYRIECFPTGEVHFYIDGVEGANSPITTNITALYLQPYLWLRTQENVAKTMDVDYVVVRQER